MKQGSASVGLVSNGYVILASIRRAESELADYTKKIFKIDEHVGIAISGLTPDGKAISKYLRTECMNEKWKTNTPHPIGRLVSGFSDKSQVLTQTNEKRPYGAGLLVAGVDVTGAHLYETSPNATFTEWRAFAIGARSQAARTYLEKNLDTIEGESSLRALILHALRAIKGASQDKLTEKNVTVGYVGKGVPFTILEDEEMKEYVDEVTAEDEDTSLPAAGPAPGMAGADADENAMIVDQME